MVDLIQANWAETNLVETSLVEKIASLSCFKNPDDIKPLDGGITNVNLLVSDQGKRYVVRLGADIPEHGVMRWNELALSNAASAAGFSPKVVHAEPGVLVIDYIDSKTYTEQDVRNPANLSRIVTFIARVHRELGTHLTQPALAFWPFQVNRTYITRLLADNSVYKEQLPDFVAQNNQLELAAGQVDLVIGHNDLLAANILDDGTRLWLIDWEYGGFNSPLFDLGGLASNNGFSEEQERQMLAQYFDTKPDAYWLSYTALKCSSLMRETLWSMTSEIHSNLDVDYASYTAENKDKFYKALSAFEQASS